MILVTAALKDELEPYFDQNDPNLELIYTGIGKINATYALTKALRPIKPKLVINFGTAASSKYPVGSIVQCIRFYERDMKCSLEEYTKYNPSYLEVQKELHFDHPGAHCYTGDGFLHYFQCLDYNGVVDMEAFALAKVCAYQRIPFVCFKVVTDGMNPTLEPDEQWRENKAIAAQSFRKIYDFLRKHV
jgi:adenosylhomocysteine nucleosidase